jgi:RNA polymerase sigma-70 factor (ECF subfamily)
MPVLPEACNDRPAVELSRREGMRSSPSEPSDERLMADVRSGEAAQLGRLFERHHVALFEFLYRTTADRSGAEDLVQDVFVRILKYRHTYREGSSFLTWMYRIARNARADHFRRRQSSWEALGRNERVDVHDAEPPSVVPSIVDQLDWDQQAAALSQALNQLPLDKRELIVLARYQGLSHQQIAELLDIDVGAVRVRVHRALRQLRDLFDSFVTGRDPCTVKTRSSTSDCS